MWDFADTGNFSENVKKTDRSSLFLIFSFEMHR